MRASDGIYPVGSHPEHQQARQSLCALSFHILERDGILICAAPRLLRLLDPSRPSAGSIHLCLQCDGLLYLFVAKTRSSGPPKKWECEGKEGSHRDAKPLVKGGRV